MKRLRKFMVLIEKFLNLGFNLKPHQTIRGGGIMCFTLFSIIVDINERLS